MEKSLTVERKIEQNINQLDAQDVFLRISLNSFGSYNQISRALNALIEKKIIIRLGYGVYARAKVSPISGKVLPNKGLATLLEALTVLGVPTFPSSAEQAYNSGKSTQVPTGRTIGVRKPITRKIGYNGIFLNYEYRTT